MEGAQTIHQPTEITISKQYSLGGVKFPPEDTQETLSVHVFACEPAVVSLEYGLTLNLGNFESCRLTVGIRTPCYKEQTEEAYKAAAAWIGEKIQKEVQEIRSNRSTKF